MVHGGPRWSTEQNKFKAFSLSTSNFARLLNLLRAIPWFSTGLRVKALLTCFLAQPPSDNARRGKLTFRQCCAIFRRSRQKRLACFRDNLARSDTLFRVRQWGATGLPPQATTPNNSGRIAKTRVDHGSLNPDTRRVDRSVPWRWHRDGAKQIKRILGHSLLDAATSAGRAASGAGSQRQRFQSGSSRR